MIQNTTPLPVFAGVEEWVELVDLALEGLHHALNNRIGSLSALVELFQAGDPPPGSPNFDTLAAELTRLADCNRVVRLLARSSVAAEEPLILDDVVADVFAIHRYLHDVRDLQVTVVPARNIEPVRLRRWTLVHVLTLLLRDVKRLAGRLGLGVRVVAASDEAWVSVQFRVDAPTAIDETPTAANPEWAGSGSQAGRYAVAVAESFGGTVDRRPGVVELRLPTLKARRAADRR